MKLEISSKILHELVVKQLNNFFLCSSADAKVIENILPMILEKCEFCFSHSKSRYYQQGGEVYFSPFHSGQYAIFLYFLSHSVYKISSENRALADKIYYLNKALNSVELFYEVELPNVFFADHPIGSVMGRANYGEFFSFAQNCSVGNNKGIYPTIGKNVRMAAGSTILGNCEVGDNVIISAHSYVKDTNIPSNSLVFGISPSLVIKSKENSYFQSPIVHYSGYEGWS